LIVEKVSSIHNDVCEVAIPEIYLNFLIHKRIHRHQIRFILQRDIRYAQIIVGYLNRIDLDPISE